MDTKYSLRDLADQVDIQPRTIRSYIEKGLIPSAEGAGRASYYGPKHLRRLLAIRVLRDIDNVDFDEIRRRILLSSEDEIESIARRLNPAAGGSAQDYLLAALERPTSPPTGVDGFSISRDEPEQASFEPRLDFHASQIQMSQPSPEWRRSSSSLAEAASHSLGHGTWVDDAVARELVSVARKVGQVPRRAKSTSARHIQITPDIELVVKGSEDPDHLTRVERLADVLRHLLMGGGRD
jgi:DNA-binding transcriptional MerR regulator